ncbi:trichohyalin-like [Ischnura elegans]|uniref:trichohyalin-like n=1 Tax=Ischnura elegans TaxID=197161 RepID=UPI001ED890A9|nr:trichohyalin-like [Ischnura elegans]
MFTTIYNHNRRRRRYLRRNRSDGRLKRYKSCEDGRAWSQDRYERHRHITDYVASNYPSGCTHWGRHIPVPVIVDLMVHSYKKALEDLQKKVSYLEKGSSGYEPERAHLEDKREADSRLPIDEGEREEEDLKYADSQKDSQDEASKSFSRWKRERSLDQDQLIDQEDKKTAAESSRGSLDSKKTELPPLDQDEKIMDQRVYDEDDSKSKDFRGIPDDRKRLSSVDSKRDSKISKSERSGDQPSTGQEYVTSDEEFLTPGVSPERDSTTLKRGSTASKESDKSGLKSSTDQDYVAADEVKAADEKSRKPSVSSKRDSVISKESKKSGLEPSVDQDYVASDGVETADKKTRKPSVSSKRDSITSKESKKSGLEPSVDQDYVASDEVEAADEESRRPSVSSERASVASKESKKSRLEASMDQDYVASDEVEAADEESRRPSVSSKRDSITSKESKKSGLEPSVDQDYVASDEVEAADEESRRPSVSSKRDSITSKESKKSGLEPSVDQDYVASDEVEAEDEESRRPSVSSERASVASKESKKSRLEASMDQDYVASDEVEAEDEESRRPSVSSKRDSLTSKHSKISEDRRSMDQDYVASDEVEAAEEESRKLSVASKRDSSISEYSKVSGDQFGMDQDYAPSDQYHPLDEGFRKPSVTSKRSSERKESSASQGDFGEEEGFHLDYESPKEWESEDAAKRKSSKGEAGDLDHDKIQYLQEEADAKAKAVEDMLRDLEREISKDCTAEKEIPPCESRRRRSRRRRQRGGRDESLKEDECAQMVNFAALNERINCLQEKLSLIEKCREQEEERVCELLKKIEEQEEVIQELEDKVKQLEEELENEKNKNIELKAQEIEGDTSAKEGQFFIGVDGKPDEDNKEPNLQPEMDEKNNQESLIDETWSLDQIDSGIEKIDVIIQKQAVPGLSDIFGIDTSVTEKDDSKSDLIKSEISDSYKESASGDCAEYEKRIAKLEEDVKNLELELETVNGMLESKNKTIDSLNNTVNVMRERLNERDKELEEKDEGYRKSQDEVSDGKISDIDAGFQKTPPDEKKMGVRERTGEMEIPSDSGDERTTVERERDGERDVTEDKKKEPREDGQSQREKEKVDISGELGDEGEHEKKDIFEREEKEGETERAPTVDGEKTKDKMWGEEKDLEKTGDDSSVLGEKDREGTGEGERDTVKDAAKPGQDIAKLEATDKLHEKEIEEEKEKTREGEEDLRVTDRTGVDKTRETQDTDETKGKESDKEELGSEYLKEKPSPKKDDEEDGLEQVDRTGIQQRKDDSGDSKVRESEDSQPHVLKKQHSKDEKQEGEMIRSRKIEDEDDERKEMDRGAVDGKKTDESDREHDKDESGYSKTDGYGKKLDEMETSGKGGDDHKDDTKDANILDKEDKMKDVSQAQDKMIFSDTSEDKLEMDDKEMDRSKELDHMKESDDKEDVKKKVMREGDEGLDETQRKGKRVKQYEKEGAERKSSAGKGEVAEETEMSDTTKGKAMKPEESKKVTDESDETRETKDESHREESLAQKETTKQLEKDDESKDKQESGVEEKEETSRHEGEDETPKLKEEEIRSDEREAGKKDEGATKIKKGKETKEGVSKRVAQDKKESEKEKKPTKDQMSKDSTKERKGKKRKEDDGQGFSGEQERQAQPKVTKKRDRVKDDDNEEDIIESGEEESEKSDECDGDALLLALVLTLDCGNRVSAPASENVPHQEELSEQSRKEATQREISPAQKEKQKNMEQAKGIAEGAKSITSQDKVTKDSRENSPAPSDKQKNVKKGKGNTRGAKSGSGNDEMTNSLSHIQKTSKDSENIAEQTKKKYPKEVKEASKRSKSTPRQREETLKKSKEITDGAAMLEENMASSEISGHSGGQSKDLTSETELLFFKGEIQDSESHLDHNTSQSSISPEEDDMTEQQAISGPSTDNLDDGENAEPKEVMELWRRNESDVFSDTDTNERCSEDEFEVRRKTKMEKENELQHYVVSLEDLMKTLQARVHGRTSSTSELQCLRRESTSRRMFSRDQGSRTLLALVNTPKMEQMLQCHCDLHDRPHIHHQNYQESQLRKPKRSTSEQLLESFSKVQHSNIQLLLKAGYSITEVASSTSSFERDD